jgi:ABC-2 type transport system ATP-binding protein
LLRTAIASVPGIDDITIDGRRLSARVADGAAAVPGVLAALDRADVAVAAVTVARPSLDDVYLRHVGRRFADAATERTVGSEPDALAGAPARVDATGGER